jgi:hypothetical protein
MSWRVFGRYFQSQVFLLERMGGALTSGMGKRAKGTTTHSTSVSSSIIPDESMSPQLPPRPEREAIEAREDDLNERLYATLENSIEL